MKKMNFLSRYPGGWKVKKGLMIFSLFLLFGFGFISANAQYVSSQEAITVLTSEVISVDKSMDALISTGNTAAVERANLKIKVFKTMVENLQNGHSVKKVIDMAIGSPAGTSTLLDFQLRNKQGSNQWLIDEILEMLTL